MSCSDHWEIEKTPEEWAARALDGRRYIYDKRKEFDALISDHRYKANLFESKLIRLQQSCTHPSKSGQWSTTTDPADWIGECADCGKKGV